MTLTPNKAVDQRVWLLFETLPTMTVPRKEVKPIRRLTALAVALSRDGLIEEAVKRASDHLHTVLDDGVKNKYSEKLKKARQAVETMTGEELRGRMGEPSR